MYRRGGAKGGGLKQGEEFAPQKKPRPVELEVAAFLGEPLADLGLGICAREGLVGVLQDRKEAVGKIRVSPETKQRRFVVGLTDLRIKTLKDFFRLPERHVRLSASVV